MRLRIQAADAAAAREEARRRLAEHGVDVASEALMVREEEKSGGRGMLRRLLRRPVTYVVQVEPQALRGLGPAARFRVASAVGADLDGSVSVRVADEGIMLRAFPPVGAAKRGPSEGEAMRLLEEKQIQDIDQAAVAAVVAQADGKWHVVAPRRPELDRDASAEVNVAEDGMTAMITLRRPYGGKALSAHDLRMVLEQAGVVKGIDEELIQRLEKAPVYDQPMVVARGQEPKPGEDGRFEFLLPDLPAGPTVREDGTVDYREIGVAKAVKAGDAVARIHPPTAGEDGWDVAGNVLKAQPGKLAKVRLGKGVELVQETGTVVAVQDGHVIVSDTVDVAPVFHVPENVDFSVGNIRFPGAVHIGGDVLEGFQVEAEGSIIVRGSVVGATVISYGGDVEVRQGIRGPGQVRVEAPRGTVKAKFVENATVRAVELQVADAILHSNVTVEKSVRVHRRDGRIAGGRIVAGELIESGFIGSVHATRTELILQSPPDGGTLAAPPSGVVKARQICYPGTVISIGGARAIVREEHSRARFVWENGAVKATVF